MVLHFGCVASFVIDDSVRVYEILTLSVRGQRYFYSSTVILKSRPAGGGAGWVKKATFKSQEYPASIPRRDKIVFRRKPDRKKLKIQ